MPRGPKGEKRPADVIGNAVGVMRIATGEEVEEMPNDGKDPAAKALGKNGGVARDGRMIFGKLIGNNGRMASSGVFPMEPAEARE